MVKRLPKWRAENVYEGLFVSPQIRTLIIDERFEKAVKKFNILTEPLASV